MYACVCVCVYKKYRKNYLKKNSVLRKNRSKEGLKSSQASSFTKNFQSS